jgi:hypothetical protein
MERAGRALFNTHISDQWSSPVFVDGVGEKVRRRDPDPIVASEAEEGFL